MVSKRPNRPSGNTTEARAAAQRAKLDVRNKSTEQETATPKKAKSKKDQQQFLNKRRASTTVEHAVGDYLADHEGGNHSPETLEWHRTALSLLQSFLTEQRNITLIGEIDAPDINAWFIHMRKTPGGHGQPRSERTIQTYARSARAFFHWLVRSEIIDRNPLDRVTFPKVGKPLIRTIVPEEFEKLLLACTPPGEVGPLADRAAARNRAILWVFYDTGIRLSELIGLRLGDFDRKHAILIVKGKGSKE